MKLSIAITILSLLPTLTLSAPSITSSLTTDVGTHIIFSYPGTTVPQRLLDLTKAGKVGGVIIFGENVSPDLPSAIASLQSAYASSPSPSGPLLIMTDQEGGKVKRVPGGPSLSAKQVGASSDPAAAATQAGNEAADALTKLGLNSNLAPVLDVYRVAGDFEDRYERSFGNTSAKVSTCGAAFARAQQGKGVLATAKHFPGLGPAGTKENTDETPVTISKSLAELRSVDEEPYKQAIKDGVSMIMTSWAVYSSLDAKFPAGLSSKWIQGELRQRLGYKGVTISDAIEAGGLKAFGDTGARAVAASKAGIDLVLASARNVTQGEEAFNALVTALQNGKLDKTAFDAGTARIRALRKGLNA